MVRKRIFIGAEVDGGMMRCAAIDCQTGKLLEDTVSMSEVDVHETAEVILEVWGGTLSRTLSGAGIDSPEGIGMAMPGPFDYENGIPLFTGQNNKYEQLYGINLPHELRMLLGLASAVPVRFINNAAAFALGEVLRGTARDTERSLSLTLGEGLGAAFIADGLPVVRGDQVPRKGCLWHLPFGDGLADDYFSLRGLIRRYARLRGRMLESAGELEQLARTDPVARAVFWDFGCRLVELLAPWLRRFQPEILVVGGMLADYNALFLPAMRLNLKKRVPGLQAEIGILKEKAALTGSGRLLDPVFWDHVSPLLKEM
ncbi:MAG: ROK family protein [Mangrovibacterium sp.]